MNAPAKRHGHFNRAHYPAPALPYGRHRLAVAGKFGAEPSVI